jgi:hypothetical protein
MLAHKCVKIYNHANKNSIIKAFMENYYKKHGEPKSTDDVIAFINAYDKVKQSIKNTG